jgi:hypothetical protein
MSVAAQTAEWARCNQPKQVTEHAKAWEDRSLILPDVEMFVKEVLQHEARRALNVRHFLETFVETPTTPRHSRSEAERTIWTTI